MRDSWQSEPLTDESAAAFFKASVDRWKAADKAARNGKRDRTLFAACMGAMGVLGMAAGLAVYIKTPVPKPPDWIVVNPVTGVAERPIAAADAPRLFNEAVRQRALREFITRCTSYVSDTWARFDFHACMIMATPEQQKRFDKDIGPGGRSYPPTVFGANGWARASKFTAFDLQETTGTEPNQLYHYEVRYERTEVVAGKETRPRYTAHVYFSFHPDLPMTDADRSLNLEGFQATSFSTTAD
jgi:type IV secretory pathway component VirB8